MTQQLYKWFALVCLTLSLALGGFSPASAATLSIELNKGKMVHLPRNASSVIIANPAVADIQPITPHLIYVYAKKIGQTSLFATDALNNTILDNTIEVTHNISQLSDAIHQMVPSADVELKTVDGGLVMKGNVDSPAESETIKSIASTFLGQSEKLVNLLNTAGSDQVMLMVKVIEVNRSELKRFGINFQSILSKGNFAFNLENGRIFRDEDTHKILQNATIDGNENGFAFNYRRNAEQQVDGVIDALENQGLVSTLAEPNLTTTSGKTANFLAGGEFPIPQVDNQGQVNVTYKPYGVSLNFTPVVMSKDKISLTVAPEVSTISSTQGLTLGNAQVQFTVPTLQTRKAQTTIELASGQTFAVAGLLSNDRSNTISKFPGLGDMPVLGALFRSHRFQNNQSELVILVTPVIVHSIAERAKVQSPLDGNIPPTDLQRMLEGNLYQRNPFPKKETPADAHDAEPAADVEPTPVDEPTPAPNAAVSPPLPEPVAVPAPAHVPEAALSAETKEIAETEHKTIEQIEHTSSAPVSPAAPPPAKQSGPVLHGNGGFILE